MCLICDFMDCYTFLQSNTVVQWGTTIFAINCDLKYETCFCMFYLHMVLEKYCGDFFIFFKF